MCVAVIRATIGTRAPIVRLLLLSDPAAACTQLRCIAALYRSNVEFNLQEVYFSVVNHEFILIYVLNTMVVSYTEFWKLESCPFFKLGVEGL